MIWPGRSTPPGRTCALTRRPLAPVLWGACAGLMLVYLSVFGLNAAAVLQRPTEQMYGEAVVLDEVQRLHTGAALYAPPSQLPLTVTAYTPVYYLVVASLQDRVGDRGYQVGRLLSLVATLIAAVLTGACAVVAGARWTGGLLASGVFLTQNLTALVWAPMHRVDTLALCLTLAGLLLAACGRTGLAAPWFALAFLTKPSFIAAPAATCLAILGCRWVLVRFVLLLGLGLLLGLAAAQQLSGGWFAWHVVVGNAIPLDLEYFAGMVGQYAEFNALPACLAAALYGLPGLPRERLWRAYLPLSGLVTVVSVGKLGASSNYWFELTAATAICLAVVVRRVATTSQPAPFGAAGLAAGVLAALLIGLPAYQATTLEALRTRLVGPLPTERGQMDLASRLAQEPGDLLTDDPGLSVLAGKPLQFEFVVFNLLARHGLWNERPILDAIAERRFSLVVLTGPVDGPPKREIESRWTDAVAQAIQAAYVFDSQQEGYWLYRPYLVQSSPP